MEGKLKNMMQGLVLSMLLVNVRSLASNDDFVWTSGIPLSTSSTETGFNEEFTLQCKNIFTQYGPYIKDLLIKKGLEATPNDACSRVGVCKQTGIVGGSMGMESLDESPDVPHFACKSCKIAATWMQNVLKDTLTRESMLSYGSKLCERMPNLAKHSTKNSDSQYKIPRDPIAINEKEFQLPSNDVLNP